MLKHVTKRVQILALIAAVLILGPAVLWAASPAMPALGSSIWPMTFHISGQYTATATNIAKFTAPVAMRLLYATASARAKGGSNVVAGSTTAETNVQILNAGTGMTTGALGIGLGNPAAAVVAEASLLATQQNIAKDAAVSADLVLLGNNPTVNDVTVTLWFQRRN